MPLELHPNDCARQARPSIWIFQGPSVGLLVVGVLFFIALFLVLSRLGVDWIPAVVISALPLALITGYVQFFVNGKAPSHALDLVILLGWRIRSDLYLAGCLDRPPELWVTSRTPAHPYLYSQDKA
jgi:hypothetical protein